MTTPRKPRAGSKPNGKPSTERPRRSPRRTPFNDFNRSYKPLRLARLAADMTIAELAEKAGIHWTTLSRIENGHTDPKAHLLQTLARALGVPQTKLYENLPTEAPVDGRP